MSKSSAGRMLRGELAAIWATSTPKVLLAASVVMAAISAVANLSVIDDLTDDDALSIAMHASTVPTMIFSIVAGLVSATAAFRYGSVDQRLLTSPTRTSPLLTKAAASALTGVAFGCVGAVAAVVVTGTYFSVNDVAFSPSSPLVVKAVIGVLIAAPMFAIGGSAVGFLVRNQPMAIGGTLAWLMVIEPTLILGLPNVGKWLPGASGIALTNSPDPGLLAQVPGGIVLTVVVVALVGMSLWRFHTSDV